MLGLFDLYDIICCIMATQLQQFDLCSLEPNINTRFVGPGKTPLKQNISHILLAKNCCVVDLDEERTSYIYREKGGIKTANMMYILNSTDSEMNFTFMHVNNVKKLLTDNGNIELFNEMDFSDPNTFFLIQNGKIKSKCKAEQKSTYSEIYEKNPFRYNNIKKITERITNNYSVFHKNGSDLHKTLQTRLKDLDKIYYAIWSMKIVEQKDDTWLPKDLNINITILLCLSYL